MIVCVCCKYKQLFLIQHIYLLIFEDSAHKKCLFIAADISKEKKLHFKDLHTTTSPVAYPHLCYSSKTNETLGAKKKMKEEKKLSFQ